MKEQRGCTGPLAQASGLEYTYGIEYPRVGALGMRAVLLPPGKGR
jgi:hypothetical protein